jgi:hypothetical protein
MTSVALSRATTNEDMTKALRRFVVAALVLLTSACGQSDTSTTPTEPSTTTPPSAVEAFSGTLQPAGTNLHTFTVAKTGYVEITLIGVVPQLVAGPSAPITVGLGIGTPNPGTGTCMVLYQVQAQAGSAAQIVGTATAGPDCLTVFDVGTLSQPVIYTVTVAHS